MKVSNIKIANTKPSGNSGGGNNSETNELVCPKCLVSHCEHCKCNKCSETNEANYLKEFDELEYQPNGKPYTTRLDIQLEVRERIKKFLISSIERARREARTESYTNGFKDGMEAERQRVVEMIEEMKDKEHCCESAEGIGCEYELALSDLQSKLGENHAK